MRFKIDENLPQEVAENLLAHGHDAVTVAAQGLNGGSDPEVSEVCRNESRVLMTFDLDFADIRNYPPADFSGIIVLRLTTGDKQSLLNVVGRLLPLLANHPLEGHLWIAEETTVRIRGA